MAGIHELFYDPLRIAYDEGRWIAPIGGHSDHVHVSFADVPDALSIIAYAQSLGLRVAENPYVGDPAEPGVHVSTSYHYRNFTQKVNGRTLGQAIDVSGSPSQMAAFADWVKRSYTGGSPAAPTPSAAARLIADQTGASDAQGLNSQTAATSGLGCLVVALAQLAAAVGTAAAALSWLT